VGDKVISDEQQKASDAYEKWQASADMNTPNYDYPNSVLNEFGIPTPKADDSKLVLGRSGPASNAIKDRLNEIAADGNTYNGLNWQDQLKKPTAPAAAKAPVDDPAARQLAWQLANKTTAPAAPPAPPAAGNTGIGGANQTAQNAASDDMESKLKDVMDERKTLDQTLADGLNNIYRDPVNAPYAKARFDQFKDEIDGAKEKDRQMFWLHSATMFATMATQPGGVIKAAMGALAQEIPLYVKDKDKADEHLDAIKKAQYDITQSEIARRVGDLKTSLDLKDKGLKETADIYKDIFKNKSDLKQIDVMASHNKAMEDIGREGNRVQLAQVNKPTSEVALTREAMENPAFKKTYTDIQGAKHPEMLEDDRMKMFKDAGGELLTGMTYEQWRAKKFGGTTIPGMSDERASKFKVLTPKG
jgi:hypothetical protein